MLGYAAEEMIGRPAWEFIEHQDDARDSILSKLADEAPCEPYERRFVRKDGTLMPVLIDSTLVRDAEGRPVGLRTAIQDISVRKAAEEALERERQQLLAIVAQAPVAMAMFDRDMRYVAHSRKWVDNMNMSGVSLVGRCHYDVVTGLPERLKEVHRRGLAGEVITCPEDSFPTRGRLGRSTCAGRSIPGMRPTAAWPASCSPPT